MRKADFDHAWSECRNSQKSHLWVGKIAIRKPEGTNSIDVLSRLTAIIGPNGAGKSSFLKGLNSVLVGAAREAPCAEISAVHGKCRGSDFTITPAEHALPPKGLTVDFLDVSFEVHRIQGFVGKRTDFDDALAEYGFRPVAGDELALYRHVCCRNYGAIAVAEIECPTEAVVTGEPDDDEIFPFFTVKVAGRNYDSRGMGFGELCACYIIWRVWRAPKGTVLLLDEPDSHLSAASRHALLDVLALLASQKQLWILFASHAAEALHVLRESEVWLVDFDETGAKTHIAPAANKRSAVRALGLAPRRRILLIVEDVDAAEALQQIINRWGGDFAASVEVQIVHGGATEVIRFLSLFPASARLCRVIAVLDGDKRGDYGGEKAVFFLPSNEDPVEAARSSVRTSHDFLATLLGVESDRLLRSIRSTEHVNHHDFCSSLLGHLGLEGVNVSGVRTALMNAWLSSTATATAAKALAEQLADQADQLPLDI